MSEMGSRKDETGHVLGVDIGGTAVKAAVVNAFGELGEKFQAPSPRTVAELRDFFHSTIEKANVPLRGVGIACKGIIDAESSRINRLPGDLNFLEGSVLGDFVGSTLPVRADNDALAEVLRLAHRRHPAFAPAYQDSGPVPVIYGCGNCLIMRDVFARLADPAFDLRFNFLGGGDTDFFVRCRQAKMKFHWAAEAVITETVPRNRTKSGWLVLRGLRIGAINYHVQRKAARTVGSRARLLAKMLAMLPLSLFRAGRLVLTEHKAIIAMHPMTVAVGSVLAAVGIEPQPYKASKIVS